MKKALVSAVSMLILAGCGENNAIEWVEGQASNLGFTMKKIDGSAITKNKPDDTFWEAAVLYNISMEKNAESLMRCQVVNALNTKPSIKVRGWLSRWNNNAQKRYASKEMIHHTEMWITFWDIAEKEELLIWGNNKTFDMTGFNEVWNFTYNHCVEGYNRRVDVWNNANPSALIEKVDL